MKGCPKDRELFQLHAGELSKTRAANIQAHINDCSICSTRDAKLIAEQENLIQHLHGLKISEASELQVRDSDIPSHFYDTGSQTNITVTKLSGEHQKSDSDSPSQSPIVTIEGYEIIEELHRGGQGVVYKAYQKSMKRDVAIKVLLGGAFASSTAKRRFEREIELVASLKHPHIVDVHDSGLTSDGQPYCVMDYIEGQRLDEYIRAKQLTLEKTLILFNKICDAITYAHQHGVIHRDLKPSNILVDKDGSPLVLDFGLAKNLGAPEDRMISVTGQIFGTLPYMSPEQALGSISEIDTRTDVYALGVILYELLTGRYPYPVVGQMADVLKHIAETPPVSPTVQWTPDSGISHKTTRRFRTSKCPIDDEVQTIVLRCLAKEKERRYPSAAGLLRDIERYLTGQAIDAKRDSSWYVLRKLMLRNAIATTALAAVLVTIISFGVISYNLYQQTRKAFNEKQLSDTLTLEKSRELESAIHADTLPAVRRMAFGWFLAAWRSDQLDWARQIQQRFPEDTPEYISTTFLIDDQYSSDQLLKEMPKDYAILAYFIIAERHLKKGHEDKARIEFEKCLSIPGQEWIKTAANASLQQLKSQQSRSLSSRIEP